MLAVPTTRGLSRVGAHHHLCQVDADRYEQLIAAADFLALGLARGERCAYVHGEIDLSGDVRAGLAMRGVDVGAREVAGALRFLSRAGIAALSAESDAARDGGFAGLCVASDLTWLGRGGARAFELDVDELCARRPLAALCQYDRERTPAAQRRDVLLAHPLVLSGSAVRENPHYVPPAEARAPADPAVELERMLATLGTPAARERQLVEICAWCKDVREGSGWSRVESWIAEREPVRFTHQLCPACATRVDADDTA